eukprot:1776656-Pleurochrysis_carterae.AAC.4
MIFTLVRLLAASGLLVFKKTDSVSLKRHWCRGAPPRPGGADSAAGPCRMCRSTFPMHLSKRTCRRAAAIT